MHPLPRPLLLSAVTVAALFLGAATRSPAQVPPRTLDTVQELAPSGAATLTVQMAFDAIPWKLWKRLVGDEPARLRTMMRHQFAAASIDDFQLEKDDLNRTAKVTMRSAAGPQLLRDGSYAVPVEKEYRLVNNSTREWFFSGNNPYAANTLVTVRLILPENVAAATLRNAGTPDQALVYQLRQPPRLVHFLVWPGVTLFAAGIIVIGLGWTRRATVRAPAPPPAAT